MGANGTLVKTINSGIDWTVQNSGTSQGLRAVYFTNANTGWAVGAYGTILATMGPMAIQPPKKFSQYFVTKNISKLYFTLPHRADVQARLLDLRGRMVAW